MDKLKSITTQILTQENQQQELQLHIEKDQYKLQKKQQELQVKQYKDQLEP